MPALTRRALFTVAIGAGLATVARVLCGGGRSVAAELSEQEVASWLEVAFGRSAALVEVGRDYLLQNPSENDFEKLRSAVFSDQYESAEAFKQSLKAAIRDDFDRGQVIALRGWQLSLTELRCCALLFLSTSD